MNWFWHTLWICLVVIPVAILWAVCIFDIVVRRGDLVWWKRLLWLVLVLFVPLLGALIYAAGPLSARSDTDFHDLERQRIQGGMSDGEYEQQRLRMDSKTRQ